MIKPLGWRKEPARHALAAKGIETGRMSGSQRALLPSSQALRSHTLAVRSEVKLEACEDLVGRALAETKNDEEAAIRLLQDQQWFDENASAVAHDHAQGLKAAGLQRELHAAFSDMPKSATVETPSKREIEPTEK